MRDIAIVGGGLVGLSAALLLRHPARQVSVIEAADLARPQAGGLNARTIALALSSVQIFRAVGLWDRLADSAAPIRQIHVSARGRWGVTRLAAADYELDALGYVIENRHLARCLFEAVTQAPGIELVDGAEFESIEQQDFVRVGYRKHRRRHQVEARIALIADGAQSRARAALEIDHETVDYAQTAVICNVEFSRPGIGTAYERFTAQGPLALLPLGGKRYACVWTLDPARAQRLAADDEATFVGALQEAFGYRLGLVEVAGDRFAVPLRRVRATALQQGRCIVAGNAANALHPVAGQSFNLALRDVAWLYESLAERRLADLDDAALQALADEYEAGRLAEQRRVIRYGDGLVTLFSNDLPVLDQLRAAGLGLLDLLPPLKAQAAFAGMGLAFGGNRVLRGHL